MDVFSLNLTAELLKYTGIKDLTIKLIDGKQSPYRPIYSLGMVELETLKTYIKINLANGFIRLFKSLIDIPILFIWIPDSIFCLCINYWALNNLNIKNQYLLQLVGESLNRLD